MIDHLNNQVLKLSEDNKNKDNQLDSKNKIIENLNKNHQNQIDNINNEMKKINESLNIEKSEKEKIQKLYDETLLELNKKNINEEKKIKLLIN